MFHVLWDLEACPFRDDNTMAAVNVTDLSCQQQDH